MEREDPAICAVCGRIIEDGVAPDLSGRCERCAESIPVRSDGRQGTNPRESEDRRHESARTAAIVRLRQRYHEARALVSTEESDPGHRGQLDWVLGVGGDDARSAAPLDARSSELVVLWLEDLIRHLEELAVVEGETRLAAEPDAAASPRHLAARGLHAATREFAEAFGRAVDAACRT
jgi:hypothetical protein